MGIPKFYNLWLRSRGYRGVIRQNLPSSVSSFSFDLNGIIHKAAQITYAYADYYDPRRAEEIKTMDPRVLESLFHNELSKLMLESINQVNPTEILVIAIDGVAPKAKITQQRQRRFRSAMESSSGNIFDSNSITPGTEFMMRLDAYIIKWIKSNQLKLPPTVIYSSHMVPGEGEHKILDMMRDGRIKGTGLHVIYGMDADLIMLGLMAPLNNIYLVREDIRDVVSIDNLRGAIIDELSTSSMISPTSIIQDFVIMTFLIGNDFLPHMPALEELEHAMETLFRIYKKNNKPFVINGNINWQNLGSFFIELSKDENAMLTREAMREIKYPSRFLQAASQKTNILGTDVLANTINTLTSRTSGLGISVTNQIKFDYNIFRAFWYRNVFSPKGNINIFQKLMPQIDFYQVSSDQIITMIYEYLKGIAWVFTYYTKGMKYVNIDYVYSYHHAPLLNDIALLMPSISDIIGYLYESGQMILNPVHQLLAVLPMKSRDLLPDEVKHLMSKDSPLADLYPLTAIIERDGKDEDWQGAILIPFINTYRIIEVVSNIIFTYKRSILFNSRSDQVFNRNIELEPLIQKEQQFRQMLAEQRQIMYPNQKHNDTKYKKKYNKSQKVISVKRVDRTTQNK